MTVANGVLKIYTKFRYQISVAPGPYTASKFQLLGTSKPFTGNFPDSREPFRIFFSSEFRSGVPGVRFHPRDTFALWHQRRYDASLRANLWLFVHPVFFCTVIPFNNESSISGIIVWNGRLLPLRNRMVQVPHVPSHVSLRPSSVAPFAD